MSVLVSRPTQDDAAFLKDVMRVVCPGSVHVFPYFVFALNWNALAYVLPSICGVFSSELQRGLLGLAFVCLSTFPSRSLSVVSLQTRTSLDFLWICLARLFRPDAKAWWGELLLTHATCFLPVQSHPAQHMAAEDHRLLSDASSVLQVSADWHHARRCQISSFLRCRAALLVPGPAAPVAAWSQAEPPVPW